MTVDKLMAMPDMVRKVCNAVSFSALAEYYIDKGEFGDMPDGIRKFLDLYAMGESLVETHNLIQGIEGFYEVRK